MHCGFCGHCGFRNSKHALVNLVFVSPGESEQCCRDRFHLASNSYAPHALHRDSAALTLRDSLGEPRPARTAYTGTFQSRVKGLPKGSAVGLLLQFHLSRLQPHSVTENIKRGVLITYST